jgi:hypothetical protein
LLAALWLSLTLSVVGEDADTLSVDGEHATGEALGLEPFAPVVESDLSHELFSERSWVELANEMVEGGVREPAWELEERAQEVVLREGFEF